MMNTQHEDDIEEGLLGESEDYYLNIQRPSLTSRFQSTMVDNFLLILLLFFLSNITQAHEEMARWLKGLILLGPFAVYEPLAAALGGTIGNRIFGIGVRKYGDENNKINIFQAYIRFIVKILLGIISFLTVNSNPEKRAIHDFASGSIMVKLEKRS